MDIDGHEFKVGSVVVFARTLYQGRDIICKGIITKVAPKSCQIKVLSKQPEDYSHYGKDWTETRAKHTKIYVIEQGEE